MVLEKEIKFILTLDALKNVQRRNFNHDDQRRENSAEHSWQIIVLAQILFPYAKNKEKIDLLRVIKMLSIHDVVEIDAASNNGVDNLAYRCVSVEDLAAEMPHTFDVVSCMEMLEHVPDPASVVRACAKLAKPEGMVFFSTINRNPKSYVHAIVGAEYLLRMVPKGTHDWQKFIAPAELARMCRQGGLDVADTAGMGYHPLWRQYHLNQDLSVNYLMACRPAA